MAFGASPQDDEEVAGAAPGVAGAIPPPPVTGFPDMSGMASPAAPGAAIPGQPPAPPVDMGTSTPVVGSSAAPAPNAALGPDDLMQPGPDLGAPTPPPGTPGAPPATSAPVATLPNGKIDTVAEEKKALDEQAGIGNDAVAAEKKLGDINATNAAGVSTAADAEAKIALQKQKDDETAIATANQQTQGWITKAQQDAQKYQGMGLHDYWDHQSTGNKVLAGISVMFGAAGRANGNPGLDMVNKAIDRDFEMQQQNIAKAKSNVETDNQMVQMGLTAKQAALADNNLKKAGALDATAAQLQSYLMKQGVPLAQAQTDKNVAALREKANATRMETLEKVHSQNVQDAHLAIEQQNADSLRLRAEKYKTKTGKGGGGGSSGAFQQFVEAAGQLKPGDPIPPEVAVLGRQAGLKPNQVAGEVDKYRNSGSTSSKKAGAGAGGVDPKLLIHDVDGTPLGLASTSRAVPSLQSDLRTNTQALEQLKKLQDANQWTSTGPLFHDAVLALAATTTAGKTDTTTAHEKGAITNWAGMPSKEGIENKIQQTKARIDAIHAQLNPLPEDYSPPARGPVGGPAPAGAPASTGGVTPAQKARAKAVLADPVARAKLNDKQLAIVTRAAM